MATMNNRAHWLAASLGGVIVGAFVLAGGVRAQEVPLDAGPHISNPGAIQPEELKRQEQIHEDYCHSQPGGICATDTTFTPERYDGPYVPPEPGHLTDCHPDPNNPEKPICVHN
jgi:hypothetical protein